MGRLEHFTQIACGRTAWARADSNAWFLRGWNEFGVQTRNSIPLVGQYPENLQEYDSRLNPVNEEAGDRAYAIREASNSLLVVIGLAKRYDEVKPFRNPSSLENQIAVPIGFAAELFDEIVTNWVVNLAGRLMVFRMDGSLSFYDLVISQYREMGPYAFFFAGMPSSLVAFFLRPEYLERALSYAIFRVVVALVSSSKNRQLYFNMIPAIRTVVSSALEFLQHPFRLHASLQSLGVVSASKWLPASTSLVPFFGTSSIRFGGTPLPILAFFMYRPLRTAVLYLKLDEPASYFRLPRRRGHRPKAKPLKRSETPSLSTLYTKVSGFFATVFSTRSSSSDSPSVPEVSPREDDVASPGGPLPMREDTLVDAGHTDTAESAQMTLRDSDTTRHLASPPLVIQVPVQPPEALDLSVQEQTARPATVVEEDDDGDDSAESTRQSSEHDASVRISSRGDENNTAVDIELETYHASHGELHQQIEEANREVQALTPSERRILERLEKVRLQESHLTYQPLYNKTLWVFRGMLSVVLLPVDAFVLRQLASYYLKHESFSTGTTLVGIHTGLSVLSGGPLWSWTNTQLIASQASKIGLCLAIRCLLDAGIMVVHTAVSVYIGRRFFGWNRT